MTKELVEVVQADRDVAFTYSHSHAIREGKWDQHPLVQAFAAHRLNANAKVEWAEIVERDTARLLSEAFTNGRNAGIVEGRLSVATKMRRWADDLRHKEPADEINRLADVIERGDRHD